MDKTHPPSYYWSCLIFTLSLICLYTCSTLAHSFHRMRLTGSVFIVCGCRMSVPCVRVLTFGFADSHIQCSWCFFGCKSGLFNPP